MIGEELPDDRLQLWRESAVAPVPAEDEAPVVVEHGVGPAPDHHRPVVVLREPHPLPVLNLGHYRGL